jgi:hypothetical protein
MREQWREVLRAGQVTLARNPGRGEGELGVLRPGLAPVRWRERYGPQQRHRARLNRPVFAWAR